VARSFFRPICYDAIPFRLPLSRPVDKNVIRDGVPRILNADKEDQQTTIRSSFG